MKTVYLAGKITGDPGYKEKFKKAEDYFLARDGFVPLNPAVLPAEGFEYAAYVRMSMAMLRECDAACFLPGWEDSPGARDEYDLAKMMRKEILFFDGSMTNQPDSFVKEFFA